MTSTAEPARHALYSELEHVIGAENAKTLMTHLPMHTAEEVATKSDIAHLETRFDRMDERFDRMDERFDRMDERFDRMDERFDRMEERLNGRIDQMHRSLVVAVVGSMTALTAIFSLVVGLLR